MRRHSRGASGQQYALIVGLIAVVAIAAVAVLGRTISTLFDNVDYNTQVVIGTADVTGPTGYTVAFTDADKLITAAEATGIGFAVTGAEAGGTYKLTVTGASGSVTAEGSVAGESFTISGVNVSTLGNGTITASLTLNDRRRNAGSPATATAYFTNDPCVGGGIGTVCADGTVFLGLSPDGPRPVYTTRCDAGMTWNGSACTGSRAGRTWATANNVTGFTSYDTGRANTAGLVAAYGSNVPAAYYCSTLNMNGYSSGWYLPAANEAKLFYAARNTGALNGTFDLSGSGIPMYGLWNSTETGIYGAATICMATAAGGCGTAGNTSTSYSKSNGFHHRCIR